MGQDPPVDATVTATKWIEFESRHFWAYDVAAGVFLKHLIDEAEASGQADTPWLSKAVSSWRVQAVIREFGSRWTRSGHLRIDKFS